MDSAGSVQLYALGKLLEASDFKIWDLGKLYCFFTQLFDETK